MEILDSRDYLVYKAKKASQDLQVLQALPVRLVVLAH